MNEEQQESSTPVKRIIVGVVLLALVVGILFQVFWNPFKPSTADRSEIKNQDFLQNLVEPQTAILYSLDPSIKADGADGFHGFKIVKEIKLNPEDIVDVTAEFKDAVDNYNETLPAGQCFTPKFAIRTVKNGKTSDFALSFECNGMKGYEQNGQAHDYNAAGNPENLRQAVEGLSSPPPEGLTDTLSPEEDPQ